MVECAESAAAASLLEEFSVEQKIKMTALNMKYMKINDQRMYKFRPSQLKDEIRELAKQLIRDGLQENTK